MVPLEAGDTAEQFRGRLDDLLNKKVEALNVSSAYNIRLTLLERGDGKIFI